MYKTTPFTASLPYIQPLVHTSGVCGFILYLGHVGGGNSCGGYTLMGVATYDTCWLTRLWSTQAKVDGIVLKAAWHWGSDSSVVNNPLGEPGRTPLYVGLPSAWGSVDGDCYVFCFSWEGSLLGTLTDISEGINHWLWRWSISLHRDPVREHGVGLIYWRLRGKGELLGNV
jgi:hypothetical protein